MLVIFILNSKKFKIKKLKYITTNRNMDNVSFYYTFFLQNGMNLNSFYRYEQILESLDQIVKKNRFKIYNFK